MSDHNEHESFLQMIGMNSDQDPHLKEESAEGSFEDEEVNATTDTEYDPSGYEVSQETLEEDSQSFVENVVGEEDELLGRYREEEVASEEPLEENPEENSEENYEENPDAFEDELVNEESYVAEVPDISVSLGRSVYDRESFLLNIEDPAPQAITFFEKSDPVEEALDGYATYSSDGEDRTKVYTPGERVRILGEEESEEKTEAITNVDISHGQESELKTLPLGASADDKTVNSISSSTQHFDYDEQGAICRIVVLDGLANGKAFHLDRFPFQIGRDPKNDLLIDDTNVSRFHAEIRNVHGKVTIVDLNSTNGFKVNGEICIEKDLHCHDAIQISETIIEFLTPGVLSKGLENVRVSKSSETLSAKFSKKRRFKKLHLIAASVMLVCGGLLYASNHFNFKEMARGSAIKKVVASEAQAYLATLKKDLENSYKQPIYEIEDGLIQQEFSKRVATLPILPKEMKERIDDLPPIVMKALLANPDFVQAAVQANGNPQAIFVFLKNKLDQEIQAKQYQKALQLSEAISFYVKDKPGFENSLKEIQDTLRTKLKFTKSNVASSSSRSKRPSSRVTAGQERQPTKEETQQFAQYMSQLWENITFLETKGRLDQALEFSSTVIKKIEEVVDQNPRYELLAEPEIKKWSIYVTKLKNQIKKVEAEAQAKRQSNQVAAQDYQVIKSLLERGQMGEALEKVRAFKENHPHHELFEKALQAEINIERSIKDAFKTLKENIELHLKTESYQAAWAEIHRFLEMIPNYAPAAELRQLLRQKTNRAASQAYNRARVYEHEVGDLISAERFYKKASEMADPESEIAKKANRGYAAVKRKNID